MGDSQGYEAYNTKDYDILLKIGWQDFL